MAADWTVLAGFGVVIAGLLLALVSALRTSRARQNRVRQLEQTNRKRMTQIAEVCGWDENGRFPDNLAEAIRAAVTPQPDPSAAGAQAVSSALKLAVEKLSATEAPDGEQLGGASFVQERHARLIELLISLDASSEALPAILTNQQLDYLFRMGARLEAYTPKAPQTAAYGFAAGLVRALLHDQGFTLSTPRPLGLLELGRAEPVGEDPDGLRQVPVIRETLRAAMGVERSSEDRIVVDCVSPGWQQVQDGKVVQSQLARVLVMDRSW